MKRGICRISAQLLKKHIIKDGEYADYEAYAVRRDVAQLLAKALPGSWFKKINYFTEIPDIDSKDDVYASVLRLYNAGILTGFDSKYRFYPDTDIDRAQMAAMINRIAFEDSRKRVVTEAERNLLRRTFTAEEIKDAAVCESCAAVTFEVKNGFACNTSVGGDPIVYFMNLLDDLDKTLYSRIRIGMRWDRERMGKSDSGRLSDFLYHTVERLVGQSVRGSVVERRSG